MVTPRSMMMWVGLVAAAATLAASPSTSTTSPASADAFAGLVAPEFADRESATAAVWSMGEAARPQLIAGVETGPPDRRERCRRILRLLDLWLDPSMPPAAVAALANYAYDAPEIEKRRRLQTAAPIAKGGSPAVLRLGLAEPSADVRRMAYGFSSAAVAGYVDGLIDALAAGRPNAAAAIDAYVAAYEDLDPAGNVLALGLARLDHTGGAAAAVAALEVKRPRSDYEKRKLARLLFDAGREKEAIAVADAGRLQLATLARAMRIHTGDAAALARPDAPIDAPLFRAAALTVTGDVAAAQALVRDTLSVNPSVDPNARRGEARACLLEGLVDDGVTRLAALGEVGVLRLQGRWAEALATPPPVGADPVTLRRYATEHEATRAETGDVRPARRGGRPTSRPVTDPDWQAAADAYRRSDFASALAPLDRVIAGTRPLNVATETPSDPSAVRAAAERVKSLCLARLGRNDEAVLLSQAADLRCAARDVVAVGEVGRLDSVGLDAIGDAEAARAARRSPQAVWGSAALAERSAGRAARRGDWPAAAAARDSVLLWHATDELVYNDPVGYLRGPCVRLIAHAHAAVAAGDPAKAAEYFRASVAYLPVDGSACIALVPKLRAAGQKGAADASFEATWTKQLELCRQYPKAASLRNTAAWTALRCDRHLDEALTLAGEAVTLRPDDAASLDTYAEALFRAGRRDDAVAAMRTAKALLPDDAVLTTRLAGFEAGKLIVPDEPE